jgi:hypothetical protein
LAALRASPAHFSRLIGIRLNGHPAQSAFDSHPDNRPGLKNSRGAKTRGGCPFNPSSLGSDATMGFAATIRAVSDSERFGFYDWRGTYW